ncbi:hypothetical protein ABE527_18270 [Brucella sp. TWI432]
MAEYVYNKPERGLEAHSYACSADKAQNQTISIMLTYRRIRRLRKWVDGPRGARVPNEIFDLACKRLVDMESAIVSQRSASAIEVIAKIVAITNNQLPIGQDSEIGVSLLSEAAAFLEGALQ